MKLKVLRRYCYYRQHTGKDYCPCGENTVHNGVMRCARNKERKAELKRWGCLYKCEHEKE